MRIFFPKCKLTTTTTTENGKCVSITLKGGEKIPADVVIVGAGVAPSTGFLKDTFQLEKDGSILVDRNLKVKQFDNIYAGGDIARYEYEFNSGHEGTVRVEHWNVASQHGRVAARNMAGKNVFPSQSPPNSLKGCITKDFCCWS